jgi:lysophospholipase L1-like esterase
MANTIYNKWVAVWGNAMSIAEHRPENYAKDITLKYPIYTPFDGDSIRLTFDNFCGTEDITIDKVTVSISNGGDKAVADTFVVASFATARGQYTDSQKRTSVNSVTIPAGQKVVTDDIAYEIKAGQTLLVSFYLQDFTQMRSAVLTTGKLSKAYFGIGDMTETAVPDIDLTKSTKWFYFLSDVDVHTTEDKHALICYGDSITAQDWPDELALIMRENGVSDMSVVRKAASGTRILREYSCITYESYGLKGANRVPREFDVAGADTIIIQQGINDIIHPVGTKINKFRPMSDLPTIEEMGAGIDRYIEEAAKKGFDIYLGTLLPIYGWRTYEDFREDMKNDFNNCLKEKVDAEHLIDFHKAVEDPADSRRFADGYDSGDHLHPSVSAYHRMAEEAYKHICK